MGRVVSTGHASTIVRVSAPVDVGIAPVVEALSAFPRVCTTASCEGKRNAGGFVWFRYGAEEDNAHEAVDFLCWLSLQLVGLPCELTAEGCGVASLRFCLALPKSAVPQVAKTLRGAAQVCSQTETRKRKGRGSR